MIEAPTHFADLIIDRFVSIDQPVPQVVLEAIICVVAPESGFQLGLDWQHAVELNGATALKLGFERASAQWGGVPQRFKLCLQRFLNHLGVYQTA